MTAVAAEAPAFAHVGSDWSRICGADCSLYVEPRAVPLGAASVAALLAHDGLARRYAGPLAGLRAALAGLPDDLVADVGHLAARFAELMAVDGVRLRLDRVDGAGCKKVHADYTDVRLIATVAGPGTEVAVDGTASDCCLRSVPTGWIALFKGHNFAPGHPPCFHRSPPVASAADRRIVVVIDTPQRA